MKRRSESTGQDFAWKVNEHFFELLDSIMGDQMDIPSVLARAACMIAKSMDSSYATVFILNRETRQLESAVIVGDTLRTINLPVNNRSLAGYCAMSGKSFLVNDAYGDLSHIESHLQFDATWDRINGIRTLDILTVPAFFKDKMVGVVQAINSIDATFEDGILVNLEKVARLVGYALYYARHHQDLLSSRQLDKEKANFMRMLIHEVKAPLGMVKTSIELISGGYLEKRQDILKKLARTGIRLDQIFQLIDDITLLAQLNAGGSLGEVKIFDLTGIVCSEVQRYEEQVMEKGLSLQMLSPDSKKVLVRFDSMGLGMVISNLLSNAVKYTREGKIEVKVYEENGNAVILVQDTGIGIPANEIPHVFQDFYRASNVPRHKVPGSGVGLTEVKKMIERFKGAIQINSEEGKGTAVKVLLPLSFEN